tara:strand:+ start:475 stop:843 length:369 start_codon:yes stop_codon:yes gene_type:complete
MPCYLFQHPKTEEVIEVFQSIKDRHEYIDDKGVKWNRIWTVPNASVDSMNDGSLEGFMKYTEGKRGGTMGDLWEASKEASEKRQQRYGHDKVKQKNQAEYSNKRKGLKHPDARPDKNSTLEL